MATRRRINILRIPQVLCSLHGASVESALSVAYEYHTDGLYYITGEKSLSKHFSRNCKKKQEEKTTATRHGAGLSACFYRWFHWLRRTCCVASTFRSAHSSAALRWSTGCCQSGNNSARGASTKRRPAIRGWGRVSASLSMWRLSKKSRSRSRLRSWYPCACGFRLRPCCASNCSKK
jgi:hypothetical protein